MRFTDIFMSVPSFLLMVVINSLFPPKVYSMILILGLFEWCQIARITRAETLSLKERDFVLASKHLGASHAHIIFKHIIPNMSASIIVAGSLAVARAILTESALSFMGLEYNCQRHRGELCCRAHRFILWIVLHWLFSQDYLLYLRCSVSMCLGMLCAMPWNQRLYEIKRSSDMNKIIDVQNLQVSFHTYAGEVQAVRNVSFFAEKGKHWQLLANLVVGNL